MVERTKQLFAQHVSGQAQLALLDDQPLAQPKTHIDGALANLPLVGDLAHAVRPTVEMFARASASYIRQADQLDPVLLDDGRMAQPADQRKSAQIRLSHVLAQIFCLDLAQAQPACRARAGEITIPGGLRDSQVDIAEVDHTGVVRFAGELKPVYLAVGRATSNRTKDVVYHSLNCHLADPKTVTLGLMVLPLWERLKGRKKSCATQIQHTAQYLLKASGRTGIEQPAHLAESAALVVVCPDSGELVLDDVPEQLRWDQAVADAAQQFEARYVKGSPS